MIVQEGKIIFITMKYQETKSKLISSQDILQKLALLQKKSFCRLQLVSFHGFTSIKSINDKFSLMRLALYSMLSKIAKLQSPENSQKIEKLFNIVKNVKCRNLVEDKGIQRDILIEVGLFGLRSFLQNKNDEQNKDRQNEQKFIHLINNIPFFDEILMRSMQEEIQRNQGEEVSIQNAEVMETAIKKIMMEQFQIKLIIIHKNDLDEMNGNRLLKFLLEADDEVNLISEGVLSRTTATEAAKSFYPFQYLKIAEKEFSRLTIYAQLEISGLKNTPEKPMNSVAYAYGEASDVITNQDNAQNFFKLEMISPNHQDQMNEQTPNRNKGRQMSINEYSLYSIDDSSMDLSSPAYLLKKMRNKMKENQDSQNKDLCFGSKDKKENSKQRSSNNSDVIPFDFSEQNIEAMINRQDPSKKKTIIRRKNKNKEKEKRSFWNILCCND